MGEGASKSAAVATQTTTPSVVSYGSDWLPAQEDEPSTTGLYYSSSSGDSLSWLLESSMFGGSDFGILPGLSSYFPSKTAAAMRANSIANRLSADNIKTILLAMTAATSIVASFQFWYRAHKRNMLSVNNGTINIILPIDDAMRAQLSIPEGKRYIFRFRTIFERSLLEVVGGNTSLRNKVCFAAERVNLLNKTSYNWYRRLLYGSGGVDWERRATSPILVLNKPSFHKTVLKCVANQVSSCYSTGYLTEALGQPVVRERFVVALTCEDASTTFLYKTRTMVTSLKMLQQIASEKNFNTKSVLLESQKHCVRLGTVQKLAEEYEKHPWKFEIIELTLPLMTGAVDPRGMGFTTGAASSPFTRWNGEVIGGGRSSSHKERKEAEELLAKMEKDDKWIEERERISLEAGVAEEEAAGHHHHHHHRGDVVRGVPSWKFFGKS